MKIVLSKNMKVVLERLFSSPNQSDFVTLSTAEALAARGLVRFGRRQRTSGRSFPQYFVSLTAAGRKWCQEHYRKVGARNAP